MTTIDVKHGDLELSVPYMEITLPSKDDNVTKFLTTKDITKVSDETLQNILNKLVATSTVYMELIVNNTPCGAEPYTVTLLGQVGVLYALLAHDNTTGTGDIDTKPIDVIIDSITGSTNEEEVKPIETIEEEPKKGGVDDELAKLANETEKDLAEARALTAKAAKEYAKKLVEQIQKGDRKNYYRWIRALIASIAVVNFAIIIVVLVSIWTTNAGGSIVGGTIGSAAFVTTVAKRYIKNQWDTVTSYPSDLYESIANTLWRDTESRLISELESLERKSGEGPFVKPVANIAEDTYTEVSQSSTEFLMNVVGEVFFKNVPFYVPLIGYVCLVSFLTITLEYTFRYVEAKYLSAEANAGTEIQKSINLVEERNTNTLQAQRIQSIENYNARQLRSMGIGGGSSTSETNTTTNNIFLNPPPEILRIGNQTQLPPINNLFNQPRFGMFMPAPPITSTITKPLALTNASANVEDITNKLSNINIGQPQLPTNANVIKPIAIKPTNEIIQPTSFNFPTNTQQVTVPVIEQSTNAISRRRDYSVGPKEETKKEKGGRSRKSTPHKVSNKRNRTYRN